MKSGLIYFFSFFSLFVIFSCSQDSEENDESLENVDLLIGTWDFESEHNYDCETDEILIERFSDSDADYPGDVVYNEDGTFLERDGLEEDGGGNIRGTWEKISETMYRFTEESPDSYTYDAEIGVDIIFENNNVFLSNITDCSESNSYDAVRWVRRE